MPNLYIVRGLPSSGKSTLAKKIGCLHLEADMFFIHEGVYCFDVTKLRAAHEWCQKTTAEALKNGFDVVVSNTFTQMWEIKPYLDMAVKLSATPRVIRTTKQYQGNLHNVPEVAIQAMRERFEDYTGEILVGENF